MSLIRTFQIDLKKFADKTGRQLAEVTKETAFDLFSRIVDKTPVDTGRARASWALQEGGMNDSVHPEIPETNKLSREQASAAAQQNKGPVSDKPHKVIYVFNNLPYIRKLEYGRHEKPPSGSEQAPEGMVDLSLAEVEADLYRIVGELD